MSLVKNKKVVKYFERNYIRVKIECSCSTNAQEKYCRINCNNVSFKKINYGL